MGMETWGLVPKSQTENVTIDQAVAAALADHETDPTAHQGEGESLQNHKSDTVIDHPADSVVTDKIPTGGVINDKIDSNARAYKAIVDINGNGDFTDIQEAISYVTDNGGGNILIMAGTYTVVDQIDMYSNISVYGQGYASTIIDFANSTGYIFTQGSFNYPQLNVHFYDLQFKRSYQTTRGALAFEYVQDSSVERCKFVGNWKSSTSLGNDIFFSGNSCQRITIADCIFSYSGTAIYGGGYYITIEHNYSDHSYASFINSTTSGLAQSLIIDNTTRYNTANNIILNTNSGYTNIIGNTFVYAAAQTIVILAPGCNIMGNYFDGSPAGTSAIVLGSNTNNTRIIDNHFYRYTASGVYLGTGSSYSLIMGNTFYSMGVYGVDIPAAACTKNIVLGCSFLSCVSGGIHNLGTSSDLAHYVTV